MQKQVCKMQTMQYKCIISALVHLRAFLRAATPNMEYKVSQIIETILPWWTDYTMTTYLNIGAYSRLCCMLNMLSMLNITYIERYLRYNEYTDLNMERLRVCLKQNAKND